MGLILYLPKADRFPECHSQYDEGYHDDEGGAHHGDGGDEVGHDAVSASDPRNVFTRVAVAPHPDDGVIAGVVRVGGQRDGHDVVVAPAAEGGVDKMAHNLSADLDAAERTDVGDDGSVGAYELPQRLQELAPARERVSVQVESLKGDVRPQLPRGERRELVFGQRQRLQAREALEGVTVDEREQVPVQVQLAQRRQIGELGSPQFRDGVVLQVKGDQLGEAVERLVADGLDAARVEVERSEVLPPHKGVGGEVGEGVAVQVDGGGIHGDELGHLGVLPAAALYDVGGPRGVVVAVAALGALHATVAGEEVAAHAEGEAVGRVGAEELGELHSRQWQHEVAARRTRITPELRGRRGAGVEAVVQAAGEVVPVGYSWELAAIENMEAFTLKSS